MARLYSDLGQRTVYLRNGLALAQGLPCLIYKTPPGHPSPQLANLAAFDPANRNAPGAPIVGGALIVDAHSNRPSFWDLDDMPCLWITVSGGPMEAIYPDSQPQLDAQAARITALEPGGANEVATAAALAAETAARTQALTAEVNARMNGDTTTAANAAADATSKANAAQAAAIAAVTPRLTALERLSGLVVFRDGENLLVRAPFDATRDILMPFDANGGAENMFMLSNPVVSSVGLIPASAADSTIWPTVTGATFIHGTGDDNVPIHTGWSYVGGNHGYSVGSQVTAAGHGKSNADVGSQWSDGTRTYTLLRVVDAATLLFANPYTVSNGIATGGVVAPAATLTHVSGATNTASVPISGGVTGAVQIHPSTYGRTYTIELDGRPVADGKTFGQVLTVTETYYVASYKGLVDTAQANIGTPVHTIMSQVPALARVSNTYRVTPATVVVAQRVTALEKTNLNMGVTQAIGLTTPAGGKLRQFMAGIGTVGGFNFSTLADLSAMTTTLNFGPATYLNPVQPAVSAQQWAYDAVGDPQWGLALGILPIADGHPTQRLKNAPTQTWFMPNTTKKNYPQIAWQKLMNPGESLSGTAYRRYLAPPDTVAEITVSDGTNTWAIIERTTTTSEGRAAAPQLLGRRLVPAGMTTIAAAERVTGEGIAYTAPTLPAYGMWQAVPDTPRLETIPGALGQPGNYFLVAQGGVTAATLTSSFNILYLFPMYLPEAVLVDRAAIEVTTAGTGVMRHGVYANDPATGLPSGVGPIADYGTVDVTTTGVKESTLSTPVLLPAGWHWYGWVWQESNTTPPALRTLTSGIGIGPLNIGNAVSLMSGARLGYFVNSVAGPLGALTVNATNSHQLNSPRVAYRRA